MAKITFDVYIEIIDRILERKGFTSSERDTIFNDQGNIDLISISFKKRINPNIVAKQIDTEPVKAMYASHLEEGKKKPTTTAGKKKKFKKVMKEFGKGKLTPYHASSSLKSKKQGGSKQEHKQALAIAFSEAGMKKESVNEATKEMPNLSSGQKYAVDFLTSLRLENVTSPFQLKKGSLEFYDASTDTKWQISGSGYLRKLNNYTQYLKTLERAKKQGWGSHVPQAWQMVYSHFSPKWRNQNVVNKLADDEYMDMAEMLSEKIRSYRKLKSKAFMEIKNKLSKI